MAAIRNYLSLIRFSHSVFALPFALVTLLVATEGKPTPRLVLLVVLAVVTARSAAMAYNQYADHRIDADNPRTHNREIPAGTILPRSALALALVCSAGFLFACWLLSPLCFALAFPVLGILLGYSHAKRFTSLAHLWLGLALGIAPVAAWVAAAGRIDGTVLRPAILGFGVLLWVAGFDILYACQDEEFDRGRGLHSLPVRLGAAAAFRLSAALHVLSIVLFALFGMLVDLGVGYFLGVTMTAGLLLWQHRIVSPTDLSRINRAFFTANGLISMTMLAGTGVDLYLLPP